MKSSKSKQIFAGVFAVGLALCLGVYLMVFNKYNEETDKLKKSNAALQQQANDLKVHYDNMDAYQADIKSMTEGIAEMTEDYQSDATEEDFLMTAVAMQSASIINYEKINIEAEEAILTIPQETVAAAKVEGLEEQIDFMERKASFGNLTDYTNLKTCIEIIYSSPYRVGIDAIAYKKDSDSDNFINGTIDISYYSLLGMNKPYKYPAMGEYLEGDLGMDLFGKLVLEEKEGPGGATND